jgi:hypothetical protein
MITALDGESRENRRPPFCRRFAAVLPHFFFPFFVFRFFVFSLFAVCYDYGLRRRFAAVLPCSSSTAAEGAAIHSRFAADLSRTRDSALPHKKNPRICDRAMTQGVTQVEQ